MNGRTTRKTTSIWTETPKRYGLVSRLLHWGMAYLLLWQLFSILLWKSFGDVEWVKTVTSFGPYHGTVGLMVLPLVILRAAWAIGNRNRRPPHAAGTMGRIALFGHIALYVLMFVIPLLALARAYGEGKGWESWGLTLMPATGTEIAWLVAPADALHSPLSWLLSILIAGHILMALFHAVVRRDGTLSRMAGPMRGKRLHNDIKVCQVQSEPDRL